MFRVRIRHLQTMTDHLFVSSTGSTNPIDINIDRDTHKSMAGFELWLDAYSIFGVPVVGGVPVNQYVSLVLEGIPNHIEGTWLRNDNGRGVPLPITDENTRVFLTPGWKLGDARDFLELDASEAEFVEIKLGLARRLRELREQHSWTQADLAGRLGSSQSRVAKMEAADSTVSVDLLVRSLLAAGADRGDVGRAVSSRRR